MAQSTETKVNLRVSPYKGRLFLFAQTKGTDQQKRRQIPGLENIAVDLSKWDKKEQRFNAPTTEAIAANSAIRTFVDGYKLVNETFTPATCAELFETYDRSTKIMAKGAAVIKKKTLGDFIIEMIDEQRTCTGHFMQLPSSTYQQYLALLRKLEKEGKLIDTPIEDIANRHCVQFSNYILKDLGGVNYKNLMKWFIAVHNKAVNLCENDHPFSFDMSDYIPRKTMEEGIRSLTPKQLETFEAYELELLLSPSTPKKALESYELYRDFAIFMYECKLRPIDTVKMRYDNIKVSVDGLDFIKYVPEKKKNLKEQPVVKCPMTEKAKLIAEKYKGQSSQGYVFPFALNEYQWDYSDPVQYKRHYSKWNRLLGEINAFLHKMEEPLGFQGLTLYMFRHTAFTIACKEMKQSYFEIAAYGGTSIKMLEDHYVSTGFQEATT